MAKAQDAFRTISEVSEELEVPKHVLRFWEDKFPALRPMKRGGGRRYYRPEDLELLRGIRHLLHVRAYQIRGVQRIFRERGVDYVKTVWQDSQQEAQASTASAPAEPVLAAAKAPPRQRRGRTTRGGPPNLRRSVINAAIKDLRAVHNALIAVGREQATASRRAATRR